MLNNNSSNKFNTQNTENNDLYVEDIYKDLYPTDNENQNIDEVNNIIEAKENKNLLLAEIREKNIIEKIVSGIRHIIMSIFS